MQFAPRVHGFLIMQVWRLDDGQISFAELNRRVGRIASRHDLPRPSYETIRRIAHRERRRRLQKKEALGLALVEARRRPADRLAVLHQLWRLAQLTRIYEPSGHGPAPPS